LHGVHEPPDRITPRIRKLPGSNLRLDLRCSPQLGQQGGNRTLITRAVLQFRAAKRSKRVIPSRSVAHTKANHPVVCLICRGPLNWERPPTLTLAPEIFPPHRGRGDMKILFWETFQGSINLRKNARGNDLPP
jgi:hypothetical protein